MYTWLTSFSPSLPLSTQTPWSRSPHIFYFLHSSPIMLVGLLKSKCMQSKTKSSPVSDPLLHHLHKCPSTLPINCFHEARLPLLVLSCVYVGTVCLSYFFASRWPTLTRLFLLSAFSHCRSPPSVTWFLPSFAAPIFAISSAL